MLATLAAVFLLSVSLQGLFAVAGAAVDGFFLTLDLLALPLDYIRLKVR
jgi:hypothetical protein